MLRQFTTIIILYCVVQIPRFSSAVNDASLYSLYKPVGCFRHVHTHVYYIGIYIIEYRVSYELFTEEKFFLRIINYLVWSDALYTQHPLEKETVYIYRVIHRACSLPRFFLFKF